MIARYDADRPPPGSAKLAVQLIAKSLRMEGFSVVADYLSRLGAAQRELHALRESGELKVLEDIRDGLEAAPSALIVTQKFPSFQDHRIAGIHAGGRGHGTEFE